METKVKHQPLELLKINYFELPRYSMMIYFREKYASYASALHSIKNSRTFESGANSMEMQTEIFGRPIILQGFDVCYII